MENTPAHIELKERIVSLMLDKRRECPDESTKWIDDLLGDNPEDAVNQLSCQELLALYLDRCLGDASALTASAHEELLPLFEGAGD